MDETALLVDLHRDTPRQGPGGDEQTRLAIALSGLAAGRNLSIADIGCGTGASTLVLARDLDAGITAVDLFATFLDKLAAAAEREGLGDRISPVCAPMEALPFADASLDAIWSEGAIYAMGFVEGIRAWRRFLKPGGILAVSELTWLTLERPDELTAHWMHEYPQVDTAAAKMAQLEDAGYAPLGYFVLPEQCWRDHYYGPLQASFADFLARHDQSAAARAAVASAKAEIDLYERFAGFFSYGFYVAQKRGA
ncbi:class I SAM-dependent methyltransferase [Aquibium carbonis]|uniref:Class I SAM-dependent methyltransferase n=1 Tax=Aquibium carbonis TaxID=2495581 RepID=A0A429YX52_9HYPH|nr:class I SAM-dependent methyltransferase [Aquibium carbonis]RST86032.1 class I SAM-dependent methyltransferase [Aquibium carbonis]